jgi:N-acetyl-gamma-glutamyl-phosphate/LysW-gamma-L-alpha-aminoadipyl-6-phosphate reductase
MSGGRLSVGIVGASGYVGGELLRLLLAHPQVEVTQITSERQTGQWAYHVHPHLRGRCTLRFVPRDALVACDVLFLAMPHGEAQTQIDRWATLTTRMIDLSADFRLRDPVRYAAAYGHEHLAPDWLPRFVYGLPEINRAALCGATYASGVGCNATATILALWALIQHRLIPPGQPLIADLKVGSSEAGNSPTPGSHHPARSGVVRPFQMIGHRHEAEIHQALGEEYPFDVRLSVTSVELVRGVAAAVHLTLSRNLDEREVWRAYRTTWNDHPFVRIVHDRTGLFRHPEPRLVAGTNYADVGWEYDPASGRMVLLSAIDNLGKGAAGSAVQCMNLMCGFDETTALTFGGLYP